METSWLPLAQEKLISISKKNIDGVTVESMIDPEDLPLAIKASFSPETKILKVLFKYLDDIETDGENLEYTTSNGSLRMIYGKNSVKILSAEFKVDLLKSSTTSDVFSYEINKIKGSQRTLNDYLKDMLDIIRKVCLQKAQEMLSLVRPLEAQIN